MQAKEMTLEEFFAGGVKYVSPSFQRGYSWKREPGERLLELMRGGEEEMFLGALVAMRLAEAPDGSRKLLLVDGTQRILTALAMLLALRDAMAAAGDAKGAAAVQDSFFSNRHADGHRSLKFIVPTKNRGAFESLAAGREPEGPGNPFLRAYRFGAEGTAGWSAERCAAAAKALGSRVKAVVLTLERDEDPYPIFKVLSPPEAEFTRTGLKEYTRFATDPELMGLIAGGESRALEFKERTLRTAKGGKGCGDGPFGVLRSVAGFMNSTNGGTLLVGVRDDGTIRGVEDEYALVDKSKGNWDGYQLYLGNMLRSRISTKNPFLLYRIERRRAQQHDVCMVRVKPSEAPAYLDKRLYVRSGNQTLEMMGPDLVNYVAERFGG